MTVKTQIVKNIDGGILVTESCTDGEAVVAAETDEFLPIQEQQTVKQRNRRSSIETDSEECQSDGMSEGVAVEPVLEDYLEEHLD